jgi:hypothetical protein
MLRWLISTIGLAALREEIRRGVQRATLAAVAAVLWIVVLAFCLAAFTVWLAGIVGVIWALLIDAGAFALIAIVVHIILAVTARRRASVVPPLAGVAAAGAIPEIGTAGATAGAIVGVVAIAFLLARQFRRK